MGFWGMELYENDTTLDVRDYYLDVIEDMEEDEDALSIMCDEFHELLEDEDEACLFWYALADTMCDTGTLIPEVKEEVLKKLNNNEGADLFSEDEEYLEEWKKTLMNLKEKLENAS